MRFVVCIGLVTASACTSQSEPDLNRVTTRAGLQAASTPTLDVGESCEAQRNLCKSGHCLATTVSGRPAFICTTLCASDSDCAVDFSCGEVAPRAYACVPPSTWLPTKATARPPPLATAVSPIDAGRALPEFSTDGGQ